MASAFFRGHGKGRMHMSEYFQPADVLKYAFFFNVKKLEANGQKLGEHHIHFLLYEIQEIFLFELVVRICTPPHGTPVARFAVGAQQSLCSTDFMK